MFTLETEVFRFTSLKNRILGFCETVFHNFPELTSIRLFMLIKFLVGLKDFKYVLKNGGLQMLRMHNCRYKIT